MGTSVHVIVVGGDRALVDHARRRIGELEDRWSRFRPGSEIRRLASAAGRPAVVSPETLTALRVALRGRRLTGGRFDPALGAEMERLGYTGDPDRAGGRGPGGHRRPARAGTAPPGPTAPGITIDELTRAVVVPPGVQLDLGGVGKGLAADLVAAELIERGARGACMNVGGDLRVLGVPPRPEGWLVGVDLETGAAAAHGAPGGIPPGDGTGPGDAPGTGPLTVPGACRPVLGLAGGGVATSSRLHRRWRHRGRDVHHLLDPSTGQPARSDLATVVVAAATAAQAEIVATAALVAGSSDSPSLIASCGATGLIVDDDGNPRPLPGWKDLAA